MEKPKGFEEPKFVILRFTELSEDDYDWVWSLALTLERQKHSQGNGDFSYTPTIKLERVSDGIKISGDEDVQEKLVELIDKLKKSDNKSLSEKLRDPEIIDPEIMNKVEEGFKALKVVRRVTESKNK